MKKKNLLITLGLSCLLITTLFTGCSKENNKTNTPNLPDRINYFVKETITDEILDVDDIFDIKRDNIKSQKKTDKNVVPEQPTVANKPEATAKTEPETTIKPNEPSTGAPEITTANYISLEEAQKIAIEKAGVVASDVRFEDTEFDLEKGRAVYELEFQVKNVEYDYDIDAITGKVLKAEWDIDD